jgi:hypothetical protein
MLILGVALGVAPAAGVKSHLFRLEVSPTGVMPAAMFVAVLRGVSHFVDDLLPIAVWPPVAPARRCFFKLCWVSLSSHSDAVSYCAFSRSLISVDVSVLILPLPSRLSRGRPAGIWLLIVTLGRPTLLSSSKVDFVMTPDFRLSFSSSKRSRRGRLATGSWKSGLLSF